MDLARFAKHLGRARRHAVVETLNALELLHQALCVSPRLASGEGVLPVAVTAVSCARDLFRVLWGRRGSPSLGGGRAGASQRSTRRRRSELAITQKELRLIAAAASIGLRSSPSAGYSAPAATGTPSVL